MSLSKVSLRPAVPRYIFLRLSSSSSLGSAKPGSSKVQLPTPTGETGFMAYGRNWSRDPKFKSLGSSAPQMGDLPSTFLLRRLGHAYEVYPLLFLTGAWFCLFCVTVYWSFNKVEIWLDRSQDSAPWDWERIRNNYWKKPTVMFDLDGRTTKRCEIMEILQDEMMEAAKKRGTRK